MDLSKYTKFLNTTTAKKEMLTSARNDILAKITSAETSHADIIEARDIMISVGIISQEEIKVVIEELVTQALQGIFGDNYSFELDNKIARNQPETEFYVIQDGKRRSLQDELGGGVVDVISFAIRIILWAVTSDRTDNVVSLDEPLKFVSRDKLQLCSEMIKTMSEILNLQFVIVTHENQLIPAADALFHVEQNNGISTISCISSENKLIMIPKTFDEIVEND